MSFFFPQKKKICFSIKKATVRCKGSEVGRAGRRSAMATEPRNYLIYLIPRVCILGRIRINDCFFPLLFLHVEHIQSQIVNNNPIQLSVSALIPLEKHNKSFGWWLILIGTKNNSKKITFCQHPKF